MEREATLTNPMEDGDPGLQWAEADAANDDGEAVMQAEREAESCPHMRRPQDCEDREREEAHGRYIEILVRNASDRIEAALYDAAKAVKDIRELMSNEVYDIELAESADGADAIADLDDAARSLRRARRIIRDRQRLLDGEG